MSLVRHHFRSEVLSLSTSMSVVLPDADPGSDGYPTLYLLHGLTDDDTAWVRYSGIERYAATRGLAVVMPQVHRSFYCDEAHGNRYWTFLTQELPTVAHRSYPLTTQRARTYVAGLSMGGYGAIKWALREPERFAAAASLSGALGLAQRTKPGEGSLDPGLWDHIFDGKSIVDSDDDVVALVGRAGSSTDLPKLYVCCGTDDALFAENDAFIVAADQAGVEVTTDFGPGLHDWNYWDRKITDVLAWLP